MFDFVYAWPLWAQILCFILGLGLGVFCLVKFCDIFVDSSVAIATKAKVSPLIIGLTVVAMGTSCPELAVSVSDSIETLVKGGHANVALGNVVGSNIANLLLVLAISVMITPIVVRKSVLKKEFPILLGVSAVTVILGCLFGLNGVTGDYAITRWEGAILVALMIGYIVYIVLTAKKHPETVEVEQTEAKPMSWAKAIILAIVGILGIALGGELVVFGAKGVALSISDAAHLNHDMAEAVVGLTVVAVGTSLPELVTSAVAAKKGQNEMALGNVIGSNLFNVLFVMGIAALINPLTTGNQIVIDLAVMMVATIATYLLAIKGKLGKWQGAIMFVAYVGYLAYLVTRTILSGA